MNSVMMDTEPPASRLRLWERTRFAIGDLAFNFYWQSITLYLLFYYTDAVGLAIPVAAFLYMAGSVWDGIVDLAVGIVADRVRFGRGGYRSYLIYGAIPLGVAFVLLYAPPPLSGKAMIAAMLAAHLLFRTLYATVNVPYSALTARITTDSRDRASIAGLRMLFGTGGAIVVALVTQPVARMVTGSPDAPQGYLVVAMLFAVLGTAILLPVGLSIREHIPEAPTRGVNPRFLVDAARSLAGNRAFLSLSAAMISMVLAGTVLSKAILYYFKYYIAAPDAAPHALAIMGIAGGLSIPLWMAAGRRFGGRLVWIASALLGLVALAGFASADIRTVGPMQLFLVVFQIAVMGINYAFWALLPDTIEYGERAGGLRVEATTFGLAALVQKVALGAAAGLFGLLFGSIGYRANVAQAAETLSGMRWIVILVPALGLSLSALFMLFNPLRRGTHDRIVADLARQRATGRSG